MDFIRPTTWDDALAAKAAQPDAVNLSGSSVEQAPSHAYVPNGLLPNVWNGNSQ